MSTLKGRTTKTLAFHGDIWPVVERWAQQNDFALVEQDESSRTYQRGKGRGTPANVFRIGQEDGKYFLEAWLQQGGWLWLSNLVFPTQMRIDGGGMKARPARDKAKTRINQLLETLGESKLA